MTLLSVIATCAEITGVFPGGRLLYKKEVHRVGDSIPLINIPEGQFIRIIVKLHVHRGEDGVLRAQKDPPFTGIKWYDFSATGLADENNENDVGAAHYITGPSAVTFRSLSHLIDPEEVYEIEYYSTVTSPITSAVIRGANPIMEMSFDLKSWAPHEPAAIPEGVNAVYFRVRVEPAN